MMNIRRTIKDNLNESNELEWIDNIQPVDPKKPQPGYVYTFVGYGDRFDIGTDDIVIIDVNENGVYFDSVTNFWMVNDNNTDRIDEEPFIRLVKKGRLRFINNGVITESEEDDFGWADDVTPTIRLFFDDYFEKLQDVDYIAISGTNNPKDKHTLIDLLNLSEYRTDNITITQLNDRTQYLWVSVRGNILSGEIEDLGKSEYMIPRGQYELFKKTPLTESDDFDWADDVSAHYTIEYILGKQLYYRDSNWSELFNNRNLTRDDIELGEIRTHSGWVVTSIESDTSCTLRLDIDAEDLDDFSVETVVYFVNLGIWTIVDKEGNLLNESDDGLGWMDDIDVTNNEINPSNATEGMRVKLGPKYNGEHNEFNPPNMVGTVTDVYHVDSTYDSPDIAVRWDNGRQQFYYDNEITFVGLNESDDGLDWMDGVPDIMSCDSLRVGDKVCFISGVVDGKGLSDQCGTIVDQGGDDVGVTNEYGEFLVAFDDGFSHDLHGANGEALCQRDTCWWVNCRFLTTPEGHRDHVKMTIVD